MKTVGIIGVLISLAVTSPLQTKPSPPTVQSCRAVLNEWSHQGNDEDAKLGYGELEDRAARLEYCYSIDRDYSVDAAWPEYVRQRASLYIMLVEAYDKAQAVRDRDFIRRHDLGDKLRQEDAAGAR
jgi:hypothetical protein